MLVPPPEELVFGERSAWTASRTSEESPTGEFQSTAPDGWTGGVSAREAEEIFAELPSPLSLSSSASSSQGGAFSNEQDEKRRKNAVAAAKSRKKRSAMVASMAQRKEELERSQALLVAENESLKLLVAENESLKAHNKTLESQLSFFKSFFSSHNAQGSAPNPEGDLPMYEAAWNDPHSPGGLELLPCGTKKRKAFACQAVVLLVVLSIGTEDFNPSTLTPMAESSLHHHTGRTLLSLGDASANAGHAQHGEKRTFSTRILQSLPLSSATKSSFLTALRLGALVWFARPAMAWVKLPARKQNRKVTEVCRLVRRLFKVACATPSLRQRPHRFSSDLLP